MDCTPKLLCLPPPPESPPPKSPPPESPELEPPFPEWPAIIRKLQLPRRQAESLRGSWLCQRYAAIGHEMRISADTVEMHWRLIRGRLRVNCNLAAIHRVHELLRAMRIEAAVTAAETPLKEQIAQLERDKASLIEQLTQLQSSRHRAQELREVTALRDGEAST